MHRILGLVAVVVMLSAAIPASTSSSLPQLAVRGAQFVDAGTGTLYVPRWVSGLSLLTRTPAQQDAFFDWAAKTGFNGVRVFAGALTWAKQTPESARAGLIPLLDRAATHGLVVEVTALTDTATGYDARQHVADIVDRLAGRRGVVLELANELGHSTQAPSLTPQRVREWGRELAQPRGIIWAVGATLASDSPIKGAYAGHGGDYATAHLDRGPTVWQQVRRVREIHRIVAAHGVPAVNNEPVGCAEPGTAGQRENDPAMFFALGALDRAFGSGGVHHSEAGLKGDLPGPVQQQCAEAYVAAHRAIESVMPGVVGRFFDAGEARSPITSARMVDGGGRDGVVAAYSFIVETRGVAVLVGEKGKSSVRWQNGWTPVRTIASRTARDGRRIAIVDIRLSARH